MEQLFEAALVVITLLLFLLWLLKQFLDARTREIQALRLEQSAQAREEQRMQERLGVLTGATTDALVLLDSSLHITFMNQPARALFGLEEAVGFRLDELSFARPLEPLAEQALEHGEVIGQTLVKGDRTFDARIFPLKRETGGGALVRLSEITELQRLGRARRDFVANISHELRTPVASLQLLADTFSLDTLKDERVSRDLLNKLRAQIDVLRQLTDELMDLALIESGQAPVKLEDTSALELAELAVERLRPMAELKNVTLELRVPGELRVLADVQGIRKVLGNLVHNAIKFTAPGGRVEVSAHRQGEDVEFAVADNGCGIAAADLPRIFERFYKADRARARANGELRGTGLGLAIARHMVEAHGGAIRVESVEGKGSTFYFTLPAGKAVPQTDQ